ncbi:Protein inturned [Armadillidium vulgare]|nr:Protein inturned [Armadillidium vulgare]
MEQFCKLIRFEFGTLSRGLSDPGRKETLDHMFLLLLEDLLSLEESVGVGQSPTTGGHVPPFTPSTSLNLGAFTDLKSRLSFGAANLLVLRDNFAKDSDCEDCLMLYNIIGCSIFYKNRLVLSHLDAESSECVFLYVERHRLLHLVDKEPVSQLVLWQKVYLPLPEEDHLSNKDIDHYLLIVGMNNFLLATLVESGNVTELMDKDAGPDPFLVDQAETTLYHLHSLHVQVACEESLVSSPIESILSTAKCNSSINKKASKSGGKVPPNLEGTPTRSPDVPSILKQKSSPTFEPRESPTCDCERSWGEGSDDSHSHSPHSRDASLVEDDDEGGGGGGEKSEIDEDRSSSRADTRLFGAPYEREVYVALEDSVPQNLQEIAFKIALGC